MQNSEVEIAVLRAFETILDAQLKAVRRLLSNGTEPQEPKRTGMSQIELAYDILKRAAKPLHVSDIIDRVEKVHGRRLDRESVVSALVKKVQRGDRFIRTGKNEFAVKEDR
jgi:hypothetical protein